MKKILPAILFLWPLLGTAQLTEDFSDGDFTANPAWSGDASKWQVSSFQLRSASNVVDDTFALSTPFAFADSAQWEFWLKLDHSTSSANFADIYLVANAANLKAALNGYFVRVGGTPDEISLYRRDGSSVTKIIDGADGRSQPASSGNVFRIRVLCRAGGVWSLNDDNTGTGSNYFLEGQVTDGTYPTGSHFGISVRQSTVSFHNDHYLDDIYAGPVIPDTVLPQFVSLSVPSDNTVEVHFSEPVEQGSAQNVLHYSADGGIGNPLSAVRDAVDNSLVHLTFATTFVSGAPHFLSMTGVTDLAGLLLADTSAAFSWYVPEPVVSGDVLINEVLFNAREGGVEFVEIYNASQKVIDLQSLLFTREDLTTHLMDPPVAIAATPLLLLPGKYMVLSDDSSRVKSQYAVKDPQAFVNMNLPDLLSTEDILILVNAAQTAIDKFHYYESWHFPLLNTFDGVSLERISFLQPTQLQSNWHSASEASGFATPGYENSQYVANANDGSDVKILPEIFSPDQDGKDDVMSLYYNFAEPGYVANAVVYDARGRKVRNLAQSVLLGTSGSLLWDGVSDDNQKARAGIYVVYLEVFNSQGDVKHFKRTCVLASHL